MTLSNSSVLKPVPVSMKNLHIQLLRYRPVSTVACVCILFFSPALFAQNVDYGKSYVNISKMATGGTIEPGDELEIRATFVVKGSPSTTVYACSFTDNIPTNTTYVPGTLRILTNEGKIFRQWTDAADGDPGTIAGNAVTINMGNGATQTAGGTIANTHRPSFYSSTCIMVASYRVTVDAVPYGTIIPLGNGTITYRTSVSGSDIFINFPAVNAIIYQNFGICTNTVGDNSILSEYGGTFGNGNVKDRVASNKVPVNYTYNLFGTNSPQDYYYGVSNNTSTGTGPANYSINPNEPYGARRVFTVWDIIGDHTNAADPLIGNPPADVNNGQNGGYMVVINAAYRTDTAFLDTVRNLCPNTYYEYSAWFRNICPRCGCDSTGKGATTSGYIPTAPNDSSGVRPTLTFNVNGMDYYSTGDLHYTGQWVKKGFTYRTGPTQTEMVINIRNNAPGGGGNDWAIDDISVATCLPNMAYSPSLAPNICQGNSLIIYDTIRSYFDNYSYYQWQRSTDNGATWSDIGAISTAIPVLNGNNEYEYITSYTIPAAHTNLSDSGDRYRVIVATTADNLSSDDCQVTDGISIITLSVLDCTVLGTSFLSVHGRLSGGNGELSWSTSKEDLPVTYYIERSTDGISYVTAGTVAGHRQAGRSVNEYSFKDTYNISGKVYYRVVMVYGDKKKYSRSIQLTNEATRLTVSSLINPFHQSLEFDIIVTENSKIEVELVDIFGKAVRKKNFIVNTGTTSLRIDDTENLPPGSYIFRLYNKGEIITRKVLKSAR